ncbi:MAG: aminotransferase class IV [Saprospiraceae bacterium]|nr:aminotransferase class IV [Saprospiraceae bacterium]
MCRLIETIQIRNGQALHLRYHQQRFDDARRQLFGICESIFLEERIQVPKSFQHGTVKCRITYAGAIEKIEWESYMPRMVKSLQLVNADAVSYPFKYADRSAIHKLMLQRGSCDDILMVKNGLITDTSYSNVALSDGSRYFTPASPLLAGTCRARLLEEGCIELADITPRDLQHFRSVLLLNAMLDWETSIVETILE